MALQPWETVTQDLEFQQQPFEVKEKVASNYVEMMKKDDPSFRYQTDDVQEQVKQKLLAPFAPKAPDTYSLENMQGALDMAKEGFHALIGGVGNAITKKVGELGVDTKRVGEVAKAAWEWPNPTNEQVAENPKTWGAVVAGSETLQVVANTLSSYMNAATGNIATGLLGVEIPKSKTVIESTARGVAEFGGIVAGPYKVAQALWKGTEEAIKTSPVAVNYLRDIAQQSAVMSTAMGIAEVAPAIGGSTTVNEATNKVINAMKGGAIIGAAYPAAGVIPTVPLRVAVGVGLLDLYRNNGKFGIDDFVKEVVQGVQTGNISPELTDKAFNYAMDIFFLTKTPWVKDSIAKLIPLSNTDKLAKEQFDVQDKAGKVDDANKTKIDVVAGLQDMFKNHPEQFDAFDKALSGEKEQVAVDLIKGKNTALRNALSAMFGKIGVKEKKLPPALEAAPTEVIELPVEPVKPLSKKELGAAQKEAKEEDMVRTALADKPIPAADISSWKGFERLADNYVEKSGAESAFYINKALEAKDKHEAFIKALTIGITDMEKVNSETAQEAADILVKNVTGNAVEIIDGYINLIKSVPGASDYLKARVARLEGWYKNLAKMKWQQRVNDGKEPLEAMVADMVDIENEIAKPENQKFKQGVDEAVKAAKLKGDEIPIVAEPDEILSTGAGDIGKVEAKVEPTLTAEVAPPIADQGVSGQPKDTPEIAAAKALAEQHNLTFNGMQKWHDGKETPVYTDNVTGSTFYATEGMDVGKKAEEVRKAFTQQVIEGQGVSAQPVDNRKVDRTQTVESLTRNLGLMQEMLTIRKEVPGKDAAHQSLNQDEIDRLEKKIPEVQAQLEALKNSNVTPEVAAAFAAAEPPAAEPPAAEPPKFTPDTIDQYGIPLVKQLSEATTTKEKHVIKKQIAELKAQYYKAADATPAGDFIAGSPEALAMRRLVDAERKAMSPPERMVKDAVKVLVDPEHADWEAIANQAEPTVEDLKGIETHPVADVTAPRSRMTEEQVQKAKDFIKNYGKNKLFGGAPGVDYIKALKDVAVYHIERGLDSVQEFVKKIVSEFGEMARGYAVKAWEQAKSEMKATPTSAEPKVMNEQAYTEAFNAVKEEAKAQKWIISDERLKAANDAFKDISTLHLNPVNLAKALVESAIGYTERTKAGMSFHNWANEIINLVGDKAAAEKLRPYLHKAWLEAQSKIGVVGVAQPYDKKKGIVEVGRFKQGLQVFSTYHQTLEAYKGPNADLVHSIPNTMIVKDFIPKQMWVVDNFGKLDDAMKGIVMSPLSNRTGRLGKESNALGQQVVMILDKYENPNDAKGKGFTAEAIDRANKLRAWEQEKMAEMQKAGVTDKQGHAIQALPGHFAHYIEKINLLGNVQKYVKDALDGKSDDIINAVTGAENVYGRTKPMPRFGPAEKRTGDMKDFETNPLVVYRRYAIAVSRILYDKPAVLKARQAISKMPDGAMKDYATNFVRDYLGIMDQTGNVFKAIDRKVARTGARSILFLNTGLQTLHMGRILTQINPELGEINTLKGLGKLIMHPAESYNEAKSVGLLTPQMIPNRFQRPMELLDKIGNFGDFGNGIAKIVAYEGSKAKIMDEQPNLSERDTRILAAKEAMRIEGMITPVTKAFAMEKLPRSLFAFKYWVQKYMENAGRAGAAAVNDPSFANLKRVGSYIYSGVLAAYISEELGLKLFHLSAYTFQVASPIAGLAMNVGRVLMSSKLSADEKMKGVALLIAQWGTPGGVSIPREIKKKGSAISANE
jgi:hypothetical protein